VEGLEAIEDDAPVPSTPCGAVDARRPSRSRQTTHPVPQQLWPNLCPEDDIDNTSGTRKSQSGKSSWNGAMKPPDAASTWMPTCGRRRSIRGGRDNLIHALSSTFRPLAWLTARTASAISATGS
jgi:hypothetical protein